MALVIILWNVNYSLLPGLHQITNVLRAPESTEDGHGKQSTLEVYCWMVRTVESMPRINLLTMISI